MSRRLIIFISLFSLLCLASCSNKKSIVPSNISVVDSLGWQDDLEFAFGGGSLKTNGNELFVGDGNSIWVYDVNTLQYLRSFGSKGKGPGEVSSHHIFTFDNEDNIIVGDFGNKRLQWFDKKGTYIKSQRTDWPWSVYNYDNNIYLTNCYVLPDFKYQMVNKDSLETILDLNEICENADIPKDKRDLKIIQKNGEIIFAFLQYEPHLCFFDSSQKNNQLIKIETVADNNTSSFSRISNIFTEEKSFFVIFCLLDKIIDVDEESDNSYDVKKRSGMQEYFCEYSYSGTLLNIWEMPDYIYSIQNSLAKSDDVFFVQDFFSTIIYKFKVN